jgi:hypothetical protein
MAQRKNNHQSNSINNSTISADNIVVGNNATLTNSKAIQSTGPEEILTLINKMQHIVQHSDLPDTQKEKCNLHLQTVAVETQEEKPDKEYAAKAMEKVLHVLKNSDIISDSGVLVQKELQPLITKMIPWLGEDKKFRVL